jgi:hypothetical protein
MNNTSSKTLFPILMIFILMIGFIVALAAGHTESLDHDDGRKDYIPPRSPKKSYRVQERPKRTFYREYEPIEDYYWGSEQKFTTIFCSNCGIRLEVDDKFCSSCGWRVN